MAGSNRLNDDGASAKTISIFYSNITFWGKAAESFLAADTSMIQMVVEHRLCEQRFPAVASKIARNFGRSYFATYAEKTGAHLLSTSGGLLIMPKRHLQCCTLERSLLTSSMAGGATDSSVVAGTVLGLSGKDPEPSAHCSAVFGGHGAALRYTSMVLRTKGVSVLFILLYLRTGEEMSDENAAIIQQIFLICAQFAGPIVVGGDWQMEPHTVAASPWVKTLHLKFLIPNVDATCTAGRGRVIDYFLVSESIFPHMTITADYAVDWKPHMGLRLTLPLRLRQHLVPTLRVPRALVPLPMVDGESVLQAELWARAGDIARQHISKWSNGTGVLGATIALVAHVPAAQMQISRDYSYNATRVEVYACLVAGMEPAEIKPFLGRGALPHVSKRPVVQREQLGQHFSSPKAACWAKIHSVLHWFQFANGAAMAPASLRLPIEQLRTLSGRLEESWLRSARPNCPATAWKSWIGAISAEAVVAQQQGYTQERISVWIARAQAQRDTAVTVRSKELKASFKKWLEEDLASGAAAAHRMVKPVNLASYTRSLDNVQTFEQWATIWHDEACAQRDNFDWKKQLSDFVRGAVSFGSRLDGNSGMFQKAKAKANEVELLDDVDALAFLNAARSYPDAKAKGIDSWSTKFLRGLPLEIASVFAQTLNMVQLYMQWPLQSMCNLMSLIPKATSGERTVAKTPMLYRIWNVIRAPVVKKWEVDTIEDWDFAAAGKSALYSAAVRSLTNELGLITDRQVATILWDLDKFFDSIDPALVLREGLKLQYPPLDLVLALSMHCAPRILVLQGTVSACILPLRSILAGCSHSMRFARLVMHDPVQHIVRSDAKVSTSTFVDDVAQVSMGTLMQVAKRVTYAGMKFANQMRARKLKLSAKSVVVATSPRLAQIISSNIAKHTKVPITSKFIAKDLGVLNNPHARRRTDVQRHRLAGAIKRCKRIAPLAKSVRRASALVYTGAFPQASWGAAAIGMSPTEVSKLTTAMASASGIVAKGRCPTTAIAVTMGLPRHPQIALLTQQVRLWIDLWRGAPQLRALAVRHWKEAHQRVVANATVTATVPASVSWNRVIGPMTATIAMLTDNGWDVSKPNVWLDPTRKGWIPDLTADVQPFLELVEHFATLATAAKAAQHWHGTGSEKGIDWEATLALRKHISKLHQPDSGPLIDEFEGHPDGDVLVWHEKSLIWLELLLTGGYWPQQRAHLISPNVLPMCMRCGREEETALHLLWTCECNQAISDARVADTQSLVPRAVDGARDCPALWLRGLLPKELIAINTPYMEHLEVMYMGNYPPQSWPAGLYHTDASGGRYGAYAQLRRCGVGICYLMQSEHLFSSHPLGSHLFQWGAYAALTGSVHTVPRAELFAILLVVMHVGSGEVCVVTDSKINVDVFSLGEEKCTAAANADLWKKIFAKLNIGSISLQLQWSKGHADDIETYTKYQVTPRNLLGNLVADALAEKGAKLGEVALQDAMNLKWHYSITKQIQSRAIVIFSSVLERASSLAKMPSAHRTPSVTSKGLMLSTRHKVTVSTGVLHCHACLQQSTPCEKGRRDFLRSECRPDKHMLQAMVVGSTKPTALPPGRSVRIGHQPLDSSHTLKVYKGLIFCTNCGYNASAKAQKLAHACQVRDKQEAMKRVIRLLQGKLPSGLSSWPNESPSNRVGACLLDEHSAAHDHVNSAGAVAG